MIDTLISLLLVASGIEKSFQHEEGVFFKRVRSHHNWPLLDYATFCGTKFPETFSMFSGRTIGSVASIPREYPWMALLIIDYHNGNVSYACGGALINDRYVLTAAHCCLLDEETKQLGGELTTVRLGVHNVNEAKTCHGGYCTDPKNVKIEKIISHEKFDEEEVHNDICLLRLKEKIKFSSSMYPICLPVFDELLYVAPGTIMTLAGWGISNKNGYVKTDGILNKVDLEVKLKTSCERKWFMNSLVKSQMCAGGDGGRDACSGDSGGPLMYKVPVRGPTRYFAMGVVSYGRECSNVDNWRNLMGFWRPGVYTKVTSFIPWILDNIRP